MIVALDTRRGDRRLLGSHLEVQEGTATVFGHQLFQHFSVEVTHRYGIQRAINDGQETTLFRGKHSRMTVFGNIYRAVGEFSSSHSHTVQQPPPIGGFPYRSPNWGT